ncbi:MAG: HD domain-containing protein [Tannerellaceae bacterium]|jgi:hydroxymethylpyrimidine pyrophosphatase-like HAD family hydrolase/HD superfamily phosphodiesterase|nr:HD domain-containing protein [Tannerellaceae bacterium]
MKESDKSTVLISDIDGTLKPGGSKSDTLFRIEKTTDGKGRFSIVPAPMPSRIQERIRYLQRSKKLAFGLCSGWPMADLLKYAPFADFFIAEQGAVVRFGCEPGNDTDVFTSDKQVTALARQVQLLKEHYCSVDTPGLYVIDRKYSCLLAFVNRTPEINTETGLQIEQFGGTRLIEIDGTVRKANLLFVEYKIPGITKDHGVREIMRRLATKQFYYYGNDTNDLPVFRMPGCVGFAPDSAKEAVFTATCYRSGPVPAGTDTVLDCMEFGMDGLPDYLIKNKVKSMFISREKELIQAIEELRPWYGNCRAVTMIHRLLPYLAAMTPPEYMHALDVAEKSIRIIRALHLPEPGLISVEVLTAAALLHDIEEFAGEPHEVAGARTAKRIMDEIGCGSMADAVAELIIRHVDKKRERTDASMILANILIDADVLSKFSLFGRFRSLLFQAKEDRMRYTKDSFLNLDRILDDVSSSLFFHQSRLMVRQDEIALSYYFSSELYSGEGFL